MTQTWELPNCCREKLVALVALIWCRTSLLLWVSGRWFQSRVSFAFSPSSSPKAHSLPGCDPQKKLIKIYNDACHEVLHSALRQLFDIWASIHTPNSFTNSFWKRRGTHIWWRKVNHNCNVSRMVIWTHGMPKCLQNHSLSHPFTLNSPWSCRYTLILQFTIRLYTLSCSRLHVASQLQWQLGGHSNWSNWTEWAKGQRRQRFVEPIGLAQQSHCSIPRAAHRKWSVSWHRGRENVEFFQFVVLVTSHVIQG